MEERTATHDSYWICPLYSFNCTITDLDPVDLGGGIAIWRMHPQVRDAMDRAVDWAIRIPQNIKRWKTTETAMDNIHDEMPPELGLIHDISEITIDSLTTLRLQHKGDVALGPLLQLNIDNDRFALGSLTRFPLFRYEAAPAWGKTTYLLLETELDTLREFWREFQDRRQKGKISSIRIAINRFNYSYGKRREDRLLDHMIALENLYLGDDKELGYKLALRAAFLLGRAEDERKEIYNCLKKAYADRGKVVHGGKQPSNLGDLVIDTEEYLRQSIKRFIKLSDQYELKDLRGRFLDQNIIEAGQLLKAK